MRVTVVNEFSPSYRIQHAGDVHPTLKKMQSFGQLRVGWHYGEGVPCAPEVLARALQLHDTFMSLGLYETDTFPGLDGGMLLTVYDVREYLEFRLTVEGHIEYCRETDNAEVDERQALTLEQAQMIVHQYRQEIWTRSASYTATTMITAKNALSPQHLHLSGAASLFLMRNAS